MYTYPAIFSPEGDAINVTFPDIPEAITCGFSEAQAMEYAVDVVELILAEYIRLKKDLPIPSSRKGRNVRTVSLSVLVQAKLALYTELRKNGLKKAELARKLGCQKSQIERLLDLRYASRMDQVEAALNAIGKSIVIDIRNAA